MDPTTTAVWAGVITLAIKTFADAKRETRLRKWAEEDRLNAERDRKAAENDRQTLKQHIVETEVKQSTARQALYELTAEALKETNGTKQLLADEIRKRNLIQEEREARRLRTGDRRASDLAAVPLAAVPLAPIVPIVEAAVAAVAENTEATKTLAEKLSSMPPPANDEERVRRRDVMGPAAMGLIVEGVDTAKEIEKHTRETADRLRDLATRPDPPATKEEER